MKKKPPSIQPGDPLTSWTVITAESDSCVGITAGGHAACTYGLFGSETLKHTTSDGKWSNGRPEKKERKHDHGGHEDQRECGLHEAWPTLQHVASLASARAGSP